MKLFKILFLPLFSIATLTVLLTVSVLNETGFCYSRARWLSDKEIIKLAIDHEIRGVIHPGLYKSASEFLAENKDCCVVDRFSSEPRLPGFLLAAFGYRNALVELFYKQPVVPPHEAPFYTAFMGVSACGKVGEWWGIDSAASERPRSAKN